MEQQQALRFQVALLYLMEGSDNMGKGSGRRAPQISRELEDLRYDLATGKITKATYKRRYMELEKQGKTKIVYRWY